MAIEKRQTITSVSEDVAGTLIRCCCEFKTMQLLWKTLWQFLKKFNIELPYDSAILLFIIYPREIKTCLHKNLYINVRFSISIIEKWKQPKCPSTGRWMNWMWYNHTKEQFSAIKREGSTDACCNMDEPCKHAKWNKPDMKDHICMIPFIWSVQNRQVHWDRRVLPRAWDGGRISDR